MKPEKAARCLYREWRSGAARFPRHAGFISDSGSIARLMPARYVRPYSKGQKNDFRDAEAIAEAVQRPTMKFVVTKTADQLNLQALHRVRERLVSQRIDIINQIRAFLLERGRRRRVPARSLLTALRGALLPECIQPRAGDQGPRGEPYA